MAVCAFCKRPVDPDSSLTYHKYEGWARKRAKGGLNALTLQEPLGFYAHYECVEQTKRGLLGQMTLVESQS